MLCVELYSVRTHTHGWSAFAGLFLPNGLFCVRTCNKKPVRLESGERGSGRGGGGEINDGLTTHNDVVVMRVWPRQQRNVTYYGKLMHLSLPLLLLRRRLYSFMHQPERERG